MIFVEECPNCGGLKEEGILFCPHCGIKFEKIYLDKEAQIEALEMKIASMENVAEQNATINELRKEVSELKGQLRRASYDIKKTRRSQSLCSSCVILYVLLAIAVLAMAFIAFNLYN